MYVAGRIPYARRTRISRWEIPFLHTPCQQEPELGEAEKQLMSIRQSCIDCCDAELKTPENGSVKRPPDDLDLGPPNSILVLFRVMVQTCTLLGCHVAIRKAIEIGPDEVCCHDFGGEKELSDAGNLLAFVNDK